MRKLLSPNMLFRGAASTSTISSVRSRSDGFVTAISCLALQALAAIVTAASAIMYWILFISLSFYRYFGCLPI